MLKELIARRLILAYAQRTGTGAGAESIDEAVGALRAQLERAGTTLEAHLAERGQTAAELRRELAWSFTWRKYLEKYLTDDRLKAHFDSRRRSFDGTELEVSQILLRPAGDSAEARQQAVEQARAIREYVLGGTLLETLARYERRFTKVRVEGRNDE